MLAKVVRQMFITKIKIVIWHFSLCLFPYQVYENDFGKAENAETPLLNEGKQCTLMIHFISFFLYSILLNKLKKSNNMKTKNKNPHKL